MYNRNVINRKECEECYAKAGRRKGKVISFSEVRPGDWGHFIGPEGAMERTMSVVKPSTLAEGLWQIGSAWGDMFGAITSVGHFRPADWEGEGITFRLKMRGTERVMPAYEPDLTTIVRQTVDGNICCQNVVHGFLGQHFHLTDGGYIAMRARDEGIRTWDNRYDNTPCKETLPLDNTIWASVGKS